MQDENQDKIREQLSGEIEKLDRRLVDVETTVKQQDDKIDSQLKAVRKIFKNCIN